MTSYETTATDKTTAMDIELTKEKLADIYRRMVTIRHFEEKAFELYAQGMIPGAIHSSAGQEATAVGVLIHLSDSDYVYSTHRGHGHFAARNAPLDKMAAELLGRRDGLCKGKGGSMHFFDVSRGLMGCNGIVGAGIPLAVGAGLTIKLRNPGRVCVVFFGDGAANQGTFHEGLNLASLWKLPVVFVCENNMYGMGTHVSRSTSVKDISVRGVAYDMPGVTVDGMDVFAVYEVAAQAIQRAREGGGPTLIEAKTYRFRGHSRGDPPYGPYRTKEELDLWKQRDPLLVFAAKKALPDEEMQRIEQEAQAAVEAAFEFAKACPYPDPDTALEDVFAN